MSEVRYGVWLYRKLIGHIDQIGDYTIFRFTDDYISDPDRDVLGLTFEDRLGQPASSHLRLPPWFSNLLPEGRLREWIAMDRGVSADREMELLAQVGHDLPGAIQVVRENSLPDELDPELLAQAATMELSDDGRAPGWHFSLAGVGLKFSMIQKNDTLTLPAFGEGGDWIVKFPHAIYGDVPLNENAMMTLAQLAGIEVPEHRLVHRDQLIGIPNHIWRGDEVYAYAVRRFDRGEDRELIHIEDFAQIRDIYPYNEAKYQGNFETVASLAYRGYDGSAFDQVSRRIAFNILISNGDAHLKNWSLVYRDRRRPTLSPAYDLACTEIYREQGEVEDLGLKFDGSRRFETINLNSFARLGRRLKVEGLDPVEFAADTVNRAVEGWPDVAASLGDHLWLRDRINESIAKRRKTLLTLY